MKKVLILFLLFIPCNSYSQGINTNPPKYYLNLMPFSFDSVFLNPASIQSINVKKEIPGGEIYFTTKNQPWDYFRLDDLLKSTDQYSQIMDRSVIPIFIIDGKVMNKESDARIDKSYYAKVTIGKLSNVAGLSSKSKKIVIVNVSLTDKDPKKDIRIRGDCIPNLDN
jgi:hypothetical protein